MHNGRALFAVLAVAACLALVCGLAGCTDAYVPENKQPTVEPPVVAQEGVLRVGVDAASFPFAGKVGDSIQGVGVDVAAAMADQMGLRVELVDVGANGIGALSDGKVDIVMGLDKARVPADSCWLSEEYLPAGIALFAANKGAGLPDAGSTPVIGAQDSSLSAWLVTQQYGTAALKPYTDMKEMFQELDAGSLPYAAAEAEVGSYVVSSLGLDAVIIALLEEPSCYCVGVSGDNAGLQAAVAKALADIRGNGMLDVVMRKWTGKPVDLSGIGLASQGGQPAPDAGPAAEPAPAEAPAEQPAAESAPAEQPAEQPAQ